MKNSSSGQTKKTSVNRQYKDSLFFFLFGNEKRKDWTLSLYNALNKTKYEDAKEIRLTTLDNVLYMGIKNDLSFMIRDEINMYEHQSTINPNMPLRNLIYVSGEYEGYIRDSKYSMYSSTLVHIPAPRFVVLYNGSEEAPEEEMLYLSDAFLTSSDDLELKVRMININAGRIRKFSLPASRCRNMHGLSARSGH